MPKERQKEQKEANVKKVKFDIQGMTCSSCSSHVEKAVCKLEGAKSVNVNLLSNSMIVEYDEKLLNNDVITKAVGNVGYSAKVSNSETQKSKKNHENNENNIIKLMKKRLIMSIIF